MCAGVKGSNCSNNFYSNQLSNNSNQLSNDSGSNQRSNHQSNQRSNHQSNQLSIIGPHDLGPV